MVNPPCLLTAVLRQPGSITSFTEADWELLLRQSRVALLTGKLAALLKRRQLWPQVPASVARHFEAALVFCARQRAAVVWEVAGLSKSFAKLDEPLVLLKGAAYLLTELAAGQGRSFNDIDILVPADKLTRIERGLSWSGWFSEPLSPYDQSYYRRWMHEIPPMKNLKSGAVLDIHHAILPLTAKYRPDSQKILAQVRGTSMPGVFVLAPEDMVIHSATHLFHEGEFEHGLRDLSDLQDMLCEFGTNEAGFWERLVPRAEQLDLLRPLYYGLHYCQRMLGTEIPPEVMDSVQAGAPSPLWRRVMDALFLRALMPDHPSCARAFTASARFLLYVRAHYLRMPLYLLLPHLLRKAWMRRVESGKKADPLARPNQAGG